VRYDFDFVRAGQDFREEIKRSIDHSTSAVPVVTPVYKYKVENDVSSLFRAYRLLLERWKQDQNFRMILVFEKRELEGLAPRRSEEYFRN